MSFSLLTPEDLHLFTEGRHTCLFDCLGAHSALVDGEAGVYFVVWAPAATAVSVFGEFNSWSKGEHQLRTIAASGLWEGFVAGVGHGDRYKFGIETRPTGVTMDKSDPFASYSESPPQNASRVWDLDYEWGDNEWMSGRESRSAHDAPVAIYEMHLGSWKRVVEEGNRSMTYRELAATLADHVEALGFTHVELMPVMEHPYGPSWGYQTTGYFAPTSRYGTPEDFMFLIDTLHQRGIGVILDWVPSHFPMDQHGLAQFDGTHLFEHADPRRGFHPDWRSAIFNYGRTEVRSFLISSAMSWLERYHADGLRVDAVASMLYLDYSRDEGEWIPNPDGGRENLDAAQFLQDLNVALYGAFPGVQIFAEESTSWPGVTRPVHHGGLGFGYKWDMGWMHDTLRYLARDPLARKYHQREITFRSLYVDAENYTLALSHDEVVHEKGSLLGRMIGDEWQRFATLRLLFLYMFTAQGKKLLFMGAELAQASEWNHDESLEWQALALPSHRGVFDLVCALGLAYRSTPALYRGDHVPEGFRWVNGDDADRSLVSYLRIDPETGAAALVVLNFTPVARYDHQVGVPEAGSWREIINSDSELYWGSGVGNQGSAVATDASCDGFDASLTLSVPPLGGIVLTSPAS